MNAKTENNRPLELDKKQIVEEFKSKLLGPLRENLVGASTAERDALEDLRTAKAIYMADYEKKQAALNEKISSLQKDLEDCSLRLEEVSRDLSNALSREDAEAEDAAKEEVDRLAMSQFIAQQRLNTLSNVRVYGDDQLYVKVLDAASAFWDAHKNTGQVAYAVAAIIDEVIEQLTSVGKTAKYRCEEESVRGPGFSTNQLLKTAWSVIENHGGKVDFSSVPGIGILEDECRKRYTIALMKGEYDESFLNTAVGDKLDQDLKALDSIRTGE